MSFIDVAVVGAGIAGLSFAREIKSRGRAPVVFERARGVGGRCATRRIDEQPVDHGVAFLHGRSERFRTELEALAAEVGCSAWPHVTAGRGLPCQPEAFGEGVVRLAPAAGVSQLAKQLARQLDVRLETEITSLRAAARGAAVEGWELLLSSGDTIRAKTLALALTVPGSRRLLTAMDPLPEPVAALLPVLDLVRTLPCLTVIARFPEGVAPPTWDLSLPETSATVHTILHDSAKRTGRKRLTLVIQARPRFSRDHLAQPAESWAGTLLAEAAALHGDWLGRPELVQPHIWRQARVDAASQLAAPLFVRLRGGAALGIVGDALHPAGGIEGAYLSGLALAGRMTTQPDRTAH